MEEGAPSSWRPPWLETMSASAPLSTASCASSASWMPLRISLPPQRFLIHSTSSQDSAGSNCLAVHSDSEPMFSTPLTWPTMLPNWRRGVPSMPRPQRGLVIMFRMLGSVSLGGADRPFFRSLWRWPMICRSSVSTSAEQLAALARSIRRSMKSRSRITYSWNQKGWLSVSPATSSIEQMLMVDSVNGMPNFLAARAARISPSACCMPVRPGGRDGHRHGHVLPDHLRAGGAVFHVHRHALAQLDAVEIASRWRGRCSRSTSRSRRSRRTCAARAFAPARAGLRCW